MSSAAPSDRLSSQLTDYIRVVRRHRWSIVGLTILALAAALALSLTRPKTYQSEVQVLVRPAALIPTNGNVPAINMKTEQGIAESTAVADIARTQLNLETPSDELLKKLSVDVATDTEILTIKYAYTSRTGAQRLAGAFADAYLKFRRDQAFNDLTAASTDLQTRIAQVNRDLASLNNQYARATTPQQKGSIGAQIRSAQGQLDLLQQNSATLANPSDLIVGQIVEPASFPKSQSSPKPIRDGALGLLAGLFLGVALAFFRERTDDRLRGRDDLEATAGDAVLAVVPWSQRLADEAVHRLVTLRDPDAPASEAYRALRSALLRAAAQDNIKTVLVTSALPGDGKTATVANLAVSLSQAGKGVAAVSADLRRPDLHRLFGLPNDTGLSKILTQQTRLSEAVRLGAGIPGITFLASGPSTIEAVELLDSDVMRRLLRTLSGASDMVLIDTGPVLAVADAMRLASLVDAVLLVVGQGTSMNDVRRARLQLNLVDAKVIGTVLNKFDPDRGDTDEYYRYYNDYYTTTPAGNGFLKDLDANELAHQARFAEHERAAGHVSETRTDAPQSEPKTIDISEHPAPTPGGERPTEGYPQYPGS